MSLSILDVLRNAEINIQNSRLMGDRIPLALAEQQLHNAIGLLSKGYQVDVDFNVLMAGYGNVDDVPEHDV